MLRSKGSAPTERSQGNFMWNMKTLALSVKNVIYQIKVFKKKLYGQDHRDYSRKCRNCH